MTAAKGAFYEFSEDPICCLNDGTAVTGATTTTNILKWPKLTLENYITNGSTGTIKVPLMANTGLLMGLDLTNGVGSELCGKSGTSTLGNQVFTTGTDPAFFFEAKLTHADVSSSDLLVVGFRQLEAYNATFANYTEKCSIGIIASANPAKIQIKTEKAGAGEVDTDTTDTWADGATKVLRINVSAAGVVTYTINGAAPTATAALTLTTATAFVPFIRNAYNSGVGSGDVVSLVYWKCGYQ